MSYFTLLLTLLLMSYYPLFSASQSALTVVSWRTNNARVDELIEQLTGEEKILLVHGSTNPGNQDTAGYIAPIPRLGIPAIELADGEAGINVVENTTSIPAQLNVAATYSRKAAHLAGYVTGREACLLNISIALAPRVNILRDPLDGSFWQSYSEDPFLNGQLGAQGVSGIQSQGVMANSKQIGPSSTGSSAVFVNSIVDLQTLHEVYWTPYEIQLKAGAATLMCSNAVVNGVSSCQYPELMTNTVRDDWNFSGIIMSDWFATQSTSQSIIAGLDLEMPGPIYYGNLLYDQIYVTKNLSESYLNRAVGRILLKYEEYGILGKTPSEILISNALPETVVNSSASIAYDIAVRSGILLKNENSTLPLRINASIGVFGPNGLQYTQGASFAERSYGFANREVSTLYALQVRTKNSSIPSAVGVDLQGTIIPTESLLSLNGTQGLSRNSSSLYSIDPTVNFNGSSALPANRTYTWQGFLLAPTSGFYRLSLQRDIYSDDGGNNNSDYTSLFSIGELNIDGTTVASGYRLYLDGGVRPWSSPIITTDGWDNIGTNIYLSAGQHNLSATIYSVINQNVSVRLCWVTPEQREQNIQKAVSLARQVETPLVFAYANSPSQVGLALDDNLDELITRISAINNNTVVVLNNADPVLMPWLSSVRSVLQMGYPGQEGGWATADLLLGNRNPQGHLPVTYPVSLNQTVTHDPKYPGRVSTGNSAANFTEGVNSGYRWYADQGIPTLFPFGHGLSYTSFEYTDLALKINRGASLYDETTVTVSFTVRNSGQMSGVAVLQVYISSPTGVQKEADGVQFPAISLVGFDDVELAPEGQQLVKIVVGARQLSYWEEASRTWILALGTGTLFVGNSVEEKVLETSFAL